MPDSFAQAVLDALAPMLYAEADTDNALTVFTEGICIPFQLVEDWASDTDEDVGWSLLLDIDRCPDEALPWLGQIVGISNLGSLPTADDQREQIRNLVNWKRGTVSAMSSAPLPYLTGSKTVLFRERFDGSGNDAPYDIQVITYAAETTDAVMTEAAIKAQKPGGDRLVYVNAAGQDLLQLKTNYATLQAVKDHYSTLSGIKVDMPI